MVNKRKGTFLIILLVVFSIFLLFYILQFDMYEAVKAKRIIDIIALPLGILALICFIYKKLKSGDYIAWNSMLTSLFIGIVIYFLFVRSVLGLALTFINSIYERNEIVKIKGIVTDKTERSGGRRGLSLHQFTILDQTGREIILDTKPVILKEYSVNDSVKIDMKKGILNLLYR
ncbi:hypothetical protein [Pedobacter sp. UBA5917]|uniref:hypothetical protein n=1 Tax=Pedobacter sp. UBA5917 TaxID=1947061 RepID=UPI0025DED5B2|nr:hypothetical protein [Pedobacter sp. UBA5917]